MENNQSKTLSDQQGKDTKNHTISSDKPIVLNPQFEPLMTPEVFKNHMNTIKDSLNSNGKNQNRFPCEVFPEAIQEIITTTNESLNFPIDFIGAALLYAISISIGNTHKIEIKTGWAESAVLYLSIVGQRGTNKSHPLSWALKPIEKRDNVAYQEYLANKEKYDKESDLSKQELVDQGIEEIVKPIWKQHIISDITPEALVETLKYNTRGLGMYADELASWFKNFDRYSKGSEEQFWLSNWNGKPITINRKTSDDIRISSPFISVGGTIQPAVLDELARNRTENGFIDRILFVYPENLKRERWSEKELTPQITDNWNHIVSNILDLPLNLDNNNNPQPKVLKFSKEAKERIFKWQWEMTDQSDKPENEANSGIYAKIEMYAARLALCLEMSHYACNPRRNKYENTVGIEAVEGAIKLVEYFKLNAIKVNSFVSKEISPLDRLPNDKKAIYKALPDTFETKKGVEIAESMGMPERSFKRLLNNKELFEKPTRGEYEKLY